MRPSLLTEEDGETPEEKQWRKCYWCDTLLEKIKVVSKGIALRVFLQPQKGVGVEFLPKGVSRFTGNAELVICRQHRHDFQAQHAKVVDRLATDDLVIYPTDHCLLPSLPISLLTLATAVLGLLTL